MSMLALPQIKVELPAFVVAPMSRHIMTELAGPACGTRNHGPCWNASDVQNARRAMIGQLLHGNDRAIVEKLLYVAGMSEALDAEGIQAACRALGIEYPPKPHGEQQA